MKLNDILNENILMERAINLIEPEDKQLYIDAIANMLHQAYAPIGGFKDIKDIEGVKVELTRIAQSPGIWKLMKRDGEIVTSALYKFTPAGRKALAVATDGTTTGKKGLMMIKADDVKMKRSYAEVSGAMEHIMVNKMGSKKLTAEEAMIVLGGKDITPSADGYHYTRLINGVAHEKIMVGHVDQALLQKYAASSSDVTMIQKAA